MEVSFGEVAVTALDGHLRGAIDQLPEADFAVELEQLREQPIDYLAPVMVEIDGNEVFTGDVIRADPVGERVLVRCKSGVALEEVEMGSFVAQDVPHQDVVYAAAREAGFDDDHLEIHGLTDLPLEVIEVLVPVRGVEVSLPRRLGRVTLLPPERVRAGVESFQPRPTFLDDFEDADCYALAFATDRCLFRAEQGGLLEVDAALSWLALRAGYGLALTPGGRPQRFERSQAQAFPSRRDEVMLRGLSTARRWVRRVGTALRRPSLDLTESPYLSPSLSERLPLADRQALIAGRRAIESDEPVQRVHALWEAFEFYAGDVTLPKLFSEDDLASLRATLRTQFSAEKRQRLETLIGMVNQPSLMMRLRAALQRDRVRLTTTEYALLRRLRDVRNTAAHGGEPERPRSEDLDWACSLLSRALVYRMARYEQMEV
jgi:hypothetical protein